MILPTLTFKRDALSVIVQIVLVLRKIAKKVKNMLVEHDKLPLRCTNLGRFRNFVTADCTTSS